MTKMNKEQPFLLVSNSTSEVIDRCVEKFKRRIAEVENIKSVNGIFNFQEIRNVQSNITSTIHEVFGEHSLEYDEHKTHTIYAGRYNMMGVPDKEVENGYRKGIQYTVTMLKGLISRLEEKKLDSPEAKENVNNSELDDLLPIYRRSFLEKKGQAIIDQAITDSVPVSIIMMDIDRFKTFNNKYGHQIGDDVLKTVSGIISKIVGSKGYVVRYGGEEICIILPNYDLNESLVLGERIRKQIEDYNFKVDGTIEKITISAGIADSGVIMNYKLLIKNADMALLKSKQDGRNRITKYYVE